MRASVFAVIALFWSAAAAQPTLNVTQVAEFADGLSQPHQGTFSPDGKLIYVTDMRNSRVRILDAMTLRHVGTFGQGELSNPHDVTFDRAGRLLVADTGNDRVAIYAMAGAQATLTGVLKGLAGPEGIAVTADGRVVVSNARGATLSVFRADTLERTVGARGAREGEFDNPHDVEVAADGSIYVVDSGNNRVQIFDADFKHRGSFGPALRLNGPKYLAFDSDRIWLADEYNHRILLLDRNHLPRGVIGTGRRGRSAGEFHQPEAVLARHPYLWVIDTYNDRIVLLRVE